jgi:hypothetical protein
MHLYCLTEYDGASKLAAIGMDDVIVNVMWALFYIYSDMDFAEAMLLQIKCQPQNSYSTSVKVANFIPRTKI